MAKTAASPILQLIRQVVQDGKVRELPDQDLLQRFHSQHDEAAFHTLLRRHGPMVLDVCRGVLGDGPDTEDAFQATFLVLAQKAGSIRQRASLGSWLHGVAHRTALKARAQSAARQKHEARAPVRQASQADELSWREVRQVLHEELEGIPERYREPLVMCYLEGATHQRAAARLGLAERTVRGRLERARELLRQRLVRRGLGPAGVLALAAWPAAGSAAVPAVLASSTVKVASSIAAGRAAASVVSARVAALTEGVLKAMLLSKIKVASAVLLTIAILGSTLAFCTHQTPAQDRGPEKDQGTQPPRVKSEDPRKAKAEAGDKPLAFKGHPHGAQFAAFVDAGKTILTADYAGSVRVLDAATGRELRSFKGIVLSQAALTPDGRTLAVGGWRKLALYDLTSGRTLWEASWQERSEMGRCWGVAFTPDGKRVVAGSDDAFLRVWEVASGKKLAEDYLVEHPRPSKKVPQVLALSPDGRTLAYGAEHQMRQAPDDPKKRVNALTLRLRDLPTGREEELAVEIVGENKSWAPGFSGIAFSADGKRLAAGVQAGPRDQEFRFPAVIRVWDVETRRELPRFGGPQQDLAALAFSPDGRTLTSLGWDGTIRFWETATGKMRRRFEAGENRSTGCALTFTPDGKGIFTGIGVPRLWDVTGSTSKDGGKQRPMTADELKALWADLASQDAEQAYQATCGLMAVPKQSVPFLDEQVRSSAAADRPRVQKLIADLDSDQFQAREGATKELKGLGEMALPALEKALTAGPSQETRRRLEDLLAERGGQIRSPEALRTVRAVEAMEHVGTAPVREFLEGLSKDLPDTWAAYQAKLALERLDKRR